MIGPVHSTLVYPRPVDTAHEAQAPARKKRDVEPTAHVEPANTTATNRSRRRTGGGIDSLGRGNIL